MAKNRVCEILGTEYPIIQAPMNWLTNAELVAAVSNAGGLGCLGPNAGQTTVVVDPIETAERMRKEIRKTRELTDKPFAVNYTLPLAHEKERNSYAAPLLQVCIEEKVLVLAVVGELVPEVIERLKNLGFTVVYRALNPTVESAKAAEAAGADIIVATGFEEGGTMPREPIGTMEAVCMICDAVKVPVMAAGGIVDKRTVAAVFALGAEGVYVGTRFIVSEENPASEVCKQDIVEHETNDLLFFHTIPSFRRVTPHKLGKMFKEMADSGATREEIGKLLHAGTMNRIGMLEGKLDEGLVTVSAAIGQIKSIKSCKQIIEDLFDGINFKDYTGLTP
ncbi:MAG: nitronate monooxygenase [Clostridiaceae bacterium]|nr:nitronate monooxygenase [Clostridiaceae bacterium]